MPRKRKSDVDASSASASAVDDPQPKDGADLRRSIRISTSRSSKDGREDEFGNPEEKEDDDRSYIDAKDFWEKAAARNPDVKQAIEDLADMDLRFRRATKRRKLQLAESSVPSYRDSPSQDTSKSHPTPKLDPSAQPSSPTTIGTFPTATEIIDREDSKQSVKRSKPGIEKEGHAEVVEGVEDSDANERGAARPPAVNSSYLPLPWKGRLGYACLNTYLRTANPPVFCSRTCRLASIIEHRHPLQDPLAPEHATVNRPDKSKASDVELGRKFVQQLGLSNAADIVKMIRWNDKYGIKFMRLSSDMFPFASHAVHGYKLEPFASEVLAEAGKVIAELGHRVTTHPGQYTQLGSPREEVVAASIRDLVYHDEMLTLLKLPPQQDRDAVMVIHMGGTYGDKAEALARFRLNYTTRLTEGIRRRLVLENDDVSWSVHDLLPVCEELNIPLVLDYHHHNIVFDASQVREGTLDISEPALADRIARTWERKGIRQKMHYSEPRPEAVEARDRRKHAARVATLPPCPADADLMIEAKDKEQAVFELMRSFRLPGFERINDVVPYEREDEDRPAKKVPKKRKRKRGAGEGKEEGVDEEEVEEASEGRLVSAEEFGMGGPLNRVYWPIGMDDWLKPKKRASSKAKRWID